VHDGGAGAEAGRAGRTADQPPLGGIDRSRSCTALIAGKDPVAADEKFGLGTSRMSAISLDRAGWPRDMLV
jgi:hypothetical protein